MSEGGWLHGRVGSGGKGGGLGGMSWGDMVGKDGDALGGYLAWCFEESCCDAIPEVWTGCRGESIHAWISLYNPAWAGC